MNRIPITAEIIATTVYMTALCVVKELVRTTHRNKTETKIKPIDAIKSPKAPLYLIFICISHLA